MFISTEDKIVQRLSRLLDRPGAKYYLLSALGACFLAGIIFWGGFNTVVEETNRMEFCIACHEMRDTVYEEYKQTVHYSNRTGVRAICSDCHVPRSWGYKMLRKIQATRELYGKIMGTIDTPEKFEAKRLQLAENEWRRMRASDSRECRNCHGLEAMQTDLQTGSAARQHLKAVAERKTCIDCHEGIAHELPEGY